MQRKNLPCSVACACLNPSPPVRHSLRRGKKGENLLWTKTWKMQRIPRLMLRAGVVVGGADNAAHHGARVAPRNNCKKFFMECWHSGKLAPKGSQACSGMGWDPHLRIPVPDKQLSLMIQLLPKEHSPAEGDNRNVTAHWGVGFARRSSVCPQTVTISKSCLLLFFFSYVLFLFISDFFFSVSWGDEVSLPSSWSPGANSGISRTEPHPTYYFSSVQHTSDFFFFFFSFFTS